MGVQGTQASRGGVKSTDVAQKRARGRALGMGRKRGQPASLDARLSTTPCVRRSTETHETVRREAGEYGRQRPWLGFAGRATPPTPALALAPSSRGPEPMWPSPARSARDHKDQLPNATKTVPDDRIVAQIRHSLRALGRPSADLFTRSSPMALFEALTRGSTSRTLQPGSRAAQKFASPPGCSNIDAD